MRSGGEKERGGEKEKEGQRSGWKGGEESVFDPNASVYSSEALYDTMSEAVEESCASQASSVTASPQRAGPRLVPSAEQSAKICAGPFRALLAKKSFVTAFQLSAYLRQAGLDDSGAMVAMLVKELREAGFLGQLVKAKGTWHVLGSGSEERSLGGTRRMARSKNVWRQSRSASSPRDFCLWLACGGYLR